MVKLSVINNPVKEGQWWDSEKKTIENFIKSKHF